jgi:Succinylglutamate desuccinylase / Aspartoacylase family
MSVDVSSVEIRQGLRHSDYASGHLISSIRGLHVGPTLIVLASIHGNEPAGSLAAARVTPLLRQLQSKVRGEVILLTGNTRALQRKVRHIDADLNRIWILSNIPHNGPSQPSEILEQRELLRELESAFARARGELFFIDLHTTSAASKPFATVGDTLRNRRFASNFPLTIVLGLEEQIDGTLLEYVNNLGLITMGIEAGQHDDPISVANHEAAIWIAAISAGNLNSDDVPKLEEFRQRLARTSGGRRVVEVRHRHAITAADNFKMEPGFTNFQRVRRGELLAHDRAGQVVAREGGLVLLPLYQGQGDDGFFLGRDVKKFWLHLSAFLRLMRIGDFVHLLPGVRRHDKDANILVVNTHVARILPLQIFHLLGFRRRRWTGDRLVVSRRAYDQQGPSQISPSILASR